MENMKDPLDNGRTTELPFDAVEEHLKNSQSIAEIADAVLPETEFKTTLTSEQIAAAVKALRQRSYSARNQHLGKMFNCVICGHRHRANASPKCEPKFTYIVNGFEVFREGKDGELVPDYRTAIDPDLKPTVRQVIGKPLRKNFASPRKNPRLSAYESLLVERTRKVFTEMGFTITEGEQAEKNMRIARKAAAHQLHREDRERARQIRNRAKKSRQRNRCTSLTVK